MRKQITIPYEEYADERALPEADAALLQRARLCVENAYAPYSEFKVGAAVAAATALDMMPTRSRGWKAKSGQREL